MSASATGRRAGAEAFDGVLSDGSMPYDIAEHRMRTFAKEVEPELHDVVPLEDARSASSRMPRLHPCY